MSQEVLARLVHTQMVRLQVMVMVMVVVMVQVMVVMVQVQVMVMVIRVVAVQRRREVWQVWREWRRAVQVRKRGPTQRSWRVGAAGRGAAVTVIRFRRILRGTGVAGEGEGVGAGEGEGSVQPLSKCKGVGRERGMGDRKSVV